MLFREIIVDNFAGGGGTSTGIYNATGRHVDIAINHDPAAITMHQANHPHTRHFQESVWDIDPHTVTEGIPVALCWLSPDCKHHSKAKGGKPLEKKIRGLAWVALRWAAVAKPRVIMLENVEEFQQWGPLLKDGRPCPRNKGREFRVFINALQRQGYTVDWRELRACDYGAPTIRKRLFLIARRDGQPIRWPKPTHGNPESLEVKKGKLLPWRTAAECIDWSIPCPSIFERKKPLAENTLKRIARGLKKFVFDSASPFIVKCNHTSSRTVYDCFRGQGLNEPLQTVTQSPGFALVAPIVSRQFGQSTGHPVNEPAATVTAGGGGKSALVSAFLAKHYGGNYTGAGVHMEQPTGAVTTVDHHALVTSHMIKMRGTNTGHSMNEPAHTITAGGSHLGEVRAFLLKYYGTNIGLSPSDPLHTVPTRDRFGLVTVHGEPYQIIDIGMRMLQPHELFRAQGFPEDYIIDVGADGRKLTKTEQVARCGNAVPPQFSEALVRANLPELCCQQLKNTG